MRVLLVEPSGLLRERLAAMLKGLGGIEIVEAVAAEEAGRIVAATRPGVVIMGAGLPDEAGLAALDALVRAKAGCRSVYLIVTSAHAAEPYRKRWLQAGADRFFDLSTQIDSLLKVVMRVCRTHLCSTP